MRAYARAASLFPQTSPARHGVEVVRDVAYAAGDDRRLDVYRAPGAATRPALLYAHGGGFSRLSRRIYGFSALTLAREGFTVFVIDHRRAPGHRYPAAHEDVALAARWVSQHASRFGADGDRLVLAGDSTGANLVTSLAIAGSLRVDEPWAREVFAAPLPVRAVAAACGLFEVRDARRYTTRAALPRWVRDAIGSVGAGYCPDASPNPTLVDPVVVLERATRLDRELPPFLVTVGDRDPVADDSARLGRALAGLGARVTATTYEGGTHGFHYLFPWQARSVACWRAHGRFLREHTGG